MTDETTKITDPEKMARIDAAIARANAAKTTGGTVSAAPGETAEDRAKRLATERAAKSAEKDVEREKKRAERQVELDKQRAERKQARETKREARLAELAARKPAHLSKVEKAAANLPEMSEAAKEVFELASGLNRTDTEVLAAHLGFLARKNATMQATTASLKVGMPCRVIGGQAKYIGHAGVVSKVQRIRCFVTLEENGKEIYLFTSDVEVTGEAPAEAPVTSTSPAVSADEASSAAATT
jgi:hypothetical protein